MALELSNSSASNQNDAGYPREKTIAHLFEEQTARTPDIIALVSDDHRLTYKELDARTNRLARYLQEAGVGPDTLVGVAIERSPDMLMAMLGILKAGGAYLPLDPGYPHARNAMVIEDAGNPLLLTTERTRARLPGTAARILSMDGQAGAIACHSAAPVASSATGINLAYVIYTSGSTGKPKGVMVEHHNVLNFFVGMDRVIGSDPGVWLAATSISFDISVLELLWTLTRGFQVVIHGEKGTDAIPGEIQRHGVTHLQMTPSVMRTLASDPASLAALGSLRKLLLGGEALPGSLVSALRRSFTGEIYNMYGPTETTIWSTVYRVEDQRASVPIGKPIVNTQVHVLDSELRPVPAGETGDLFIGGDGVARGYWNRPELTAERFLPDPFRSEGRLYRTGDVARFQSDGNLEFLGRADFQVKIRGFRIELGEIEAVLEQQSSVQQTVVVACEDQQGDKRLAAYVVAKAGGSPTANALRSTLEATLPDYMVPSHFVFLDRLPLTANGKIDRKALPPVTFQAAAAESADELPLSEIEQIVAQAWKEVLGIERVRRSDNFFDLGGHSLAALQITFKIRQTLHVEFSLQTFAEAPMLSDQAKQLEEMLLEQADAGLLDKFMSEIEQKNA